MNCRPGDLAITTHPTLSTLVSVIYAAPAEDFILPDGHKAPRQTAEPSWVCEAMGSLFPVLAWEKGVSRPALRRYAVIADRWLRPIRGDGLADDTPTDVEQPQTVGA